MKPDLPVMVLLTIILSPIVSATAVAQTPGSVAATSTYLPYGTMGGFVPYTPGAGRGLGVMERSGVMGPNAPRTGMGMLGERPGLGSVRGFLSPLAPIGTASRVGMGQGGMPGASFRPMPSAGGMGGMARPAVGGYPFRIPPSLLGPVAPAPGMSM